MHFINLLSDNNNKLTLADASDIHCNFAFLQGFAAANALLFLAIIINRIKIQIFGAKK
jgi:hypothetical protein